MIAKRTVKGNQALLVAAGGGGAGTNSGLPGAAMDGILPGTVLDPINGSTATVNQGGAAGDSGTTFNAAWPATDGSMWQGGNGCEFGAGGIKQRILLIISLNFNSLYCRWGRILWRWRSRNYTWLSW